MLHSKKATNNALNTTGGTKHAIVIGGSIAGLLSARVLADYFDQVTIVERDNFPSKPVPRPGVPQSQQLHVLLTQGLRIMEQLFPGLKEELAHARSLNYRLDSRLSLVVTLGLGAEV